MKAFIVIVIVALLLTGVVQASKMWKANTDLQARAEHYLDFVDETSMESVKKDLAADAKKFDIDLPTRNINISYQDTDQRNMAQKMVGGRLGAQFTNKLITITAHYTARILLVPVTQTVDVHRIRQVAAPVLPPSKATQELLDSNP
jgi:hypothetical protein